MSLYYSKLVKETGASWLEVGKFVSEPIEKLVTIGKDTSGKRFIQDVDWSKVTSQHAHQYLNLQGWATEFAIHSGNASHLFMPGREFCDWLGSCVPALEPSHAKTVVEALRGNKVGVLHFPSGSGLFSVAFMVHQHGVLSNGQEAPEFGNMFLTASCGNPANLAQCSVMLSESGSCSPEFMYYSKLVIGLGMYISCFPETVIAGLPDGLKHPSMHKYKCCFSIGVAPKISSTPTGSHESPTPHFRRGHFRILRSDKFKNKRFQAVFIHETFVKGKAETILSPEQCATI